jgi:hypothetical protein
MAKKKKPVEENLKSIKIKREVYLKVRKNKELKGTPIGFFVESAIEEKFKRETL